MKVFARSPTRTNYLKNMIKEIYLSKYSGPNCPIYTVSIPKTSKVKVRGT